MSLQNNMQISIGNSTITILHEIFVIGIYSVIEILLL